MREDGRRAARFDPRASVGLFVGVSRFEDRKIRAVPYAVDDAVDLAHLFALELELVAPARVRLALAGEPEKEESRRRLAALLAAGAVRSGARKPDLIDALDDLDRDLGPDGLALFAAASHGKSFEGKTYLLAADSRASELLDTALNGERLVDRLSLAVARGGTEIAGRPVRGRGLVLFDACRGRFDGHRGAGGAEDPATSTAAGFATAIARAHGLAVLSGAVLGDPTYDDPERGNGVFTAAILDGLRGEAKPGPDGWITASTLADFAGWRVLDWIEREWPEYANGATGISRQIETLAADLPLAEHPEAIRKRDEVIAARERFRARVDAGLDKLNEVIRKTRGGILTGADWDRARELFDVETPGASEEKLLGYLEQLNETELAQEGLRAFLARERGSSARLGNRAPTDRSAREEDRPGDTATAPRSTANEPPSAAGSLPPGRGEVGTGGRPGWGSTETAGDLGAPEAIGPVGASPLLSSPRRQPDPSPGGGTLRPKGEAGPTSGAAQGETPTRLSIPGVPSVPSGAGGGAPLPEGGLLGWLGEGPGVRPVGEDAGKKEKASGWEESRWGKRLAVASALVVGVGVAWVLAGGLTKKEEPAPEPPKANAPSAGTPDPGPKELNLPLLYVPSGDYWIGSPKDEVGRLDDETRHPVKLTRGVWLGETEVTQAAWHAVMKTTPWEFKGCGPTCPVESVSWYDAIAFMNALSAREDAEACYRGCTGTPGTEGYDCSKATFVGLECAGYRLPTEAEWEIAARAIESGKDVAEPTYAGEKMEILGANNSPQLEEIAWYGGNSGVEYAEGYDCSGWPERPADQATVKWCGPHPAGQRSANAWGFRDLLGNVWEWTADGFADFSTAPAEDPLIEEGPARVVRGGSWLEHARYVRAADRDWLVPGNRYGVLGFRLARGQGLRSGQAARSAE